MPLPTGERGFMEVKFKICTQENLRHGQHKLAVVKKESFDVNRGTVRNYQVLIDNFGVFSYSTPEEAAQLQREVNWDSLQLNFSFLALGIIKYYAEHRPNEKLILLVNPSDYEEGAYDDLSV